MSLNGLLLALSTFLSAVSGVFFLTGHTDASKISAVCSSIALLYWAIICLIERNDQ